MFNEKKVIDIDFTVECEYESELKEIKEIIKQIIDLKGLTNIEIDEN